MHGFLKKGHILEKPKNIRTGNYLKFQIFINIISSNFSIYQDKEYSQKKNSCTCRNQMFKNNKSSFYPFFLGLTQDYLNLWIWFQHKWSTIVQKPSVRLQAVKLSSQRQLGKGAGNYNID